MQMPRYNAILAVLRHAVHVRRVFPRPCRSGFVWTLMLCELSSYGGIFELGAREYTLVDFHAL